MLFRSEIKVGDLGEAVAVVPFHERDISGALRFALDKAKNENFLLIDADLRSPNDFEFSSFGMNKVSTNELNAKLDTSSAYIGFDRYAENPGEFYVSDDYRKIFNSLDYDGKILIVTPPINTLSGRLYDPFLASAFASEVIVFKQ